MANLISPRFARPAFGKEGGGAGGGRGGGAGGGGEREKGKHTKRGKAPMRLAASPAASDE